ncbi:hypothetical protein M0802_016295 [Mischocyttarus mexicanus]|nr:hypothetical protein M0802_016295 [Mischocyttarus mexicanus]
MCLIRGGTSEAQWEDVTGSTPLTFMNDRVSFTTTVSARFWLMDCRNISEVPKMATEFFVIYSKRMDTLEATLRILCMTDGKEGMHTLERQEEFLEIVKSRDVEALHGKDLYIEFSGNLTPVTKSGVQLKFTFKAFRQNRLSFHVKVKDPLLDPVARMLFMREPKVAKGEPPQQPICVLNIVLPEVISKIEIQKKLTAYEDSNIISQKLDFYKSKYGMEQKEKGDRPKDTSPSEEKFIADTMQKEQTDHQLNIINETTSTMLDVNDDNLKTDNESSMNKISTDLCELKEINCEIGTKVESSQNCLNIISNNDDSKSNDENCSNSSNESCEVKQKNNDDQCKLIKDDKNDDNNDNNCESIVKSCSSKSTKDTTTNTTTTTTTPTCMKQKRKSRSTRRRLNAMISNSSMHFSDTDSEGELVIMEAYAHTPSPVKLRQCHPIISVTMDDIENNSYEKSDTNKENFKLSSTICESSARSSRCNSFTENLTDVDEVYSGEELETIEQNNQLQCGRKKSFIITEINCQGETDIEDLIIDEDDFNDDQQSVIYLTPRMDLLCEFGGETITTKEGDGPFSVEIRNRMFKDINKVEEGDEEIDNHNSLDVLIIPTTDSEDMEMSDNDDDDIQEASSSKRVLFDDLDVLSASQIVMTNVNKTDNVIGLKDNQEDSNIGDSHTDVEDVD